MLYKKNSIMLFTKTCKEKQFHSLKFYQFENRVRYLYVIGNTLKQTFLLSIIMKKTVCLR